MKLEARPAETGILKEKKGKIELGKKGVGWYACLDLKITRPAQEGTKKQIPSSKIPGRWEKANVR